jgi:hypothetical protein
MTLFSKKPFFLLAFGFVAVSLLFTSCDQDDDEGEGTEQEVITTVLLNFTDGDGNVTTFSFRDTDGDGGNAPVIDEIMLAANTEYKLDIEFKDESNPDDVKDITEEVEEEALEHLVCFGVSGVVDIPVTLDTDSAGNALGLENQLTTTAEGNGTLTIVLKHEPEKDNADACNTGETDVEATFSVRVQ